MSDGREDVLAELIDDAGEYKRKIEILQKRYDATCNNIKVVSLDVKSISGGGKFEGSKYNCTIRKILAINYDYDKMQETLGEDLFSEVVDKKYSLVNAPEFLQMLREYGVPAKEVKKYISSDKTISKTKVQKLFDQGIIDLNDIKDCYSASVTRSVSISEKK